MAKDAVFTMKLEAELREAFVDAAKSEDRPASQVLRELMRAYVEGRRDAEAYDAFVARKVAISLKQAAAGNVVDDVEVSRMFAERWPADEPRS